MESRALSSVEKQNKARRIRERLADEESTVNRKGFERQQKRSEKQRRKDAAELEQLERDINALDENSSPGDIPPSASDNNASSTTSSRDGVGNISQTVEESSREPEQPPVGETPSNGKAEEEKALAKESKRLAKESQNYESKSTRLKREIEEVKDKKKRRENILTALEDIRGQGDTSRRGITKNLTAEELVKQKVKALVALAREAGAKFSDKDGNLRKSEIVKNLVKRLKEKFGVTLRSVGSIIVDKRPGVAFGGKTGYKLDLETSTDRYGAAFVADLNRARPGTFGTGPGFLTPDGLAESLTEDQIIQPNEQGLVDQDIADALLERVASGEKIVAPGADATVYETTEEMEDDFISRSESELKQATEDDKNRITPERFDELSQKNAKDPDSLSEEEINELDNERAKREEDSEDSGDFGDSSSFGFLGTDKIPGAVKTLMKNYSKGADKLFARLEGKFEGLSALGSLPDQDKFLKIRNKLGGRLQAVDKIAKDVFDVFTQAGEQDQLAVLDFLTERDASASIIKDKAVRQTAVRVKKTFSSSGKQLVSRGLLTQETFEKYQGAYLPRLYLANLAKGDLDATGMFKLPSGKKVSNFGFLKQRKDIPQEVRDTILGEIKNAGFLAATGLNTELRDLAILDTLDKMATNPNWVFPESVTMWPVKKDGELAKNASPVSVFWLKAQSEKLDAEANRVRNEEPFDDEGFIEGGTGREKAEKRAQALTDKAERMREAIESVNSEIADIDLSGLPSAAIRRLGNKASAVEIKNEANRLRDQADFVDETRGDRMLELAETLENLVSPELEGLSEKDFKRVPDNKRYGALQGALINKEIYDDFIESMDSVDTEMGLLEKTTALWKLSKVALNPPSQVRNFVSNMVLLQLSGIPMRKMPGYFIETLKQMRAKTGEAYNIARRNGIGASTFSSQEMNLLQNEFLKIDGNKEAGYFTKVREMAEAVARIASNAYGGIEAIGKVMKIQDELSKGVKPTDAVIEANKWLFDYSLVPKKVNTLRRLPIGIPFLTFYYKAFPRMVETAVKTPWRFAPYVALSMGMAAVFKESNDLDDDDVEKLRDILPGYLKGKPGVIPLPNKDANGNWQFVDISYFYPWAQYSQFFNTLFDDKPGKIDRLLGTVGLFGGPVPTATAGLTTNIDPFTNKEIVDEGALPGEKIARMMGWLYNIMTPPWLQYGPNGSPEAFKGATQKIIEAYQGKNINKYTNEPKRTVSQAWLRMVGLNVYPIDYTQSRKVNLIRMRAEILNKKRSGIQALGNPNKTKEEKAEIREAYTNEIKLLQAQAKEYQKSSKISDPEQKKALLRKDKN